MRAKLFSAKVVRPHLSPSCAIPTLLCVFLLFVLFRQHQLCKFSLPASKGFHLSSTVQLLSTEIKEKLNSSPTIDVIDESDESVEDSDEIIAERATPKDDAQLFKRAISVEQSDGSSPKKIAFLFITRGLLPLAPLWQRFFQGHKSLFSVYIHSDPRYPPPDNKSLPPAFQSRLIPSKSVQWGSIEVLNAERRLLANSLLDKDNHFMVVLSERCIPLFNFSFVYSYITQPPRDFVTVSKSGRSWSELLLPEVSPTVWAKGDTWKAITRNSARLVLSDAVFFPKFAKLYACKQCTSPGPHGLADEHYIPTLLNAANASNLVPRTLTWVDWGTFPRRYHPPWYRYFHVNASMLRGIRSKTVFYPFCNTLERAIPCVGGDGERVPCYLFARKFAKGALKPLMKLSRAVLGY